jgi:murein DD-endopeptidase MepM/ murein hydrolase activator NlpD
MARPGLVVAAGLAAVAAVLAVAGPASAAKPKPMAAPTVAGGPVKVRASASTSAAVVRKVANGARLSISCQVWGQQVHGKVRTTVWWDRLSNGGYLSDGYVKRSVQPSRCVQLTPPSPTAKPAPAPSTTTFPPVVLPPVSGQWVKPVNATVGQGFRPAGNPNHDGDDIMAARDVPILAASAGTVITVVCNASTNNCDVDGSQLVLGCGWYVEVLHPGPVVTRYCHLGHRPLVSVGQPVTTDQVLGYVGSSGNSSAPHLHFEVHAGQPASRANATDPAPFMIARNAPLGRT